MILKETSHDLPGWPLWPDQRAGEYVGVKNGTEHEQLLPPGFAGAVFRLVGKLVGLFLCQGSRPILQRTQQMEAGRALHLFKPSDRHHRRQWLAFAFDDELVVAEGDTVQEVAELLTNF